MTGDTIDDSFTLMGTVREELFRGETLKLLLSFEEKHIRDGQGRESDIPKITEIPLIKSMKKLGLFSGSLVLVDYEWDNTEERHYVSRVSTLTDQNVIFEKRIKLY